MSTGTCVSYTLEVRIKRFAQCLIRDLSFFIFIFFSFFSQLARRSPNKLLPTLSLLYESAGVLDLQLSFPPSAFYDYIHAYEHTLTALS